MNDKHGYAQPNIQNIAGNEHQIAAHSKPTPLVTTQLTSWKHPQRKTLTVEQQTTKPTQGSHKQTKQNCK
jgi:hypothetical protein